MTIESWANAVERAKLDRPRGSLASTLDWYADDTNPPSIVIALGDARTRCPLNDFPKLRERLKELLAALGEPRAREPVTTTLKQLQEATARADAYIRACARQGIAAGPHINAPIKLIDGAVIWQAPDTPFSFPASQITFRITRDGDLQLDPPVLVKG